MLSDEVQIANLCHRYPELLDTGDHGSLAALFEFGQVECFAPDAAPLGANVGVAGVRAFYDGAVVMHDGEPRTRHVITNLIIEIEESGETARTRSYFQVVQQAPGLPLQIIASGRYHDSFRKRNGQWWFETKRILADYMGNVTQHSAAVHAIRRAIS